MSDVNEREALALALYNHEPLYQRRPEGTEQRRGWIELYASEKVIYYAPADAVLSHLSSRKTSAVEEREHPRCIGTPTPPGYWASCLHNGSPCKSADAPMRWAIHKASRTYEGGTYSGPSLRAAGVSAGPYDTLTEAQDVVTRLDTVNAVGWVVVPYRARGYSDA